MPREMVCDCCTGRLSQHDVDVATDAGWSYPICGDCYGAFCDEQAPCDPEGPRARRIARRKDASHAAP